MMEILKWAVVVIAAITTTGLSVFLAAALALNKRIDRDQEHSASPSPSANVVPLRPGDAVHHRTDGADDADAAPGA